VQYTPFSSVLGLADVVQGIYMIPVDTDFKVEMRSGAVAGGADLADTEGGADDRQKKPESSAFHSC